MRSSRRSSGRTKHIRGFSSFALAQKRFDPHSYAGMCCSICPEVSKGYTRPKFVGYDNTTFIGCSTSLFLLYLLIHPSDDFLHDERWLAERLEKLVLIMSSTMLMPTMGRAWSCFKLLDWQHAERSRISL